MFGCPARLSVASIDLPIDEISRLQTEEDIEHILKSKVDGKDEKDEQTCTSEL